MTYLLTFTCYGTRLPGDREDTVDRKRNQYGAPYIPMNAYRAEANRRRMDQPPYLLDLDKASIVLKAMLETCEYRKWQAHALHVRTNHVHAVIAAQESPERILNDLKAYATRKLNQTDSRQIKRWTRHGSTRYLFEQESISAAVAYVLHEQGEPMAVYPKP